MYILITTKVSLSLVVPSLLNLPASSQPTPRGGHGALALDSLHHAANPLAVCLACGDTCFHAIAVCPNLSLPHGQVCCFYFFHN